MIIFFPSALLGRVSHPASRLVGSARGDCGTYGVCVGPGVCSRDGRHSRRAASDATADRRPAAGAARPNPGRHAARFVVTKIELH